MNVNSKVAAVGLALLMVTSVLPPGMVGTAEAQSASSTYTVIQGSNCWEVEPYEPYDDNPDGPGSVQPHVEIVTHTEEGGSTRNSSWDGSPTIESVMDYRYRDPEGGVHGDEQEQPWGQIPEYAPWLAEFYWKEGWQYGTYGLWNWSENQESHMFFYSGPEGDSVVMRHDKLYDGVPEGSKAPYNGRNGPGDGYMSPQPGGGAVTFIFRDLPRGEWAYMDDLYPEGMDAIYYPSGEFDYDPDRHTRYGHRNNDYGAAPIEEYSGGTDFTAHWMWHGNGTDGGAYRGLHNLGPGESMTIEPYFDEESYYWSERSWWWDRDEGDGITDWVIRRKNGENVRLDKNQAVEIRRGSHCPDASLATSHGGSPEAGANVTFTTGEERSGATYSWDFDGDGTPERNTSSASVSHAFDSSGEREISVTVETADGIRDSDSMTVEVVPSQPPTARLNVEPGNRGLDEYHIVGEELTLNASASTDNSGALAEYHWDFGDGANATGGAQVGYSYDEPGNYQVTVTVTDPAGNTDTETLTVEIDEPDQEAPTARGETEPTEVEAGAPVTFDGGDSDDNRGIATYEWDYTSDGSYDAATENATFTPENAPYTSPGIYNATLRVTDGNGNTDTATVQVTVTEPAPPTINDVSVQDEVSAGEEFPVSVDADDESGIASVTYEFSDGTTLTADGDGSVTHTFQSAGEGRVDVTVVDRAGVTATTERTINVTQEPAAALSLTTNGTAPNGTETGETVTFDASDSEDVDGNIVEYRWNFDGDGDVDETTNATGDVVTHEYDSGGTYTAEVTVEDDSGLTDTATAEIEIEADEQAIDNGGSSGSTGGSVSTGPPPVNKDTEQTGPNSAAVDVRNARGDQTIRTDLPETEVAGQTGVTFEHLAVDLASDNPHVVFETAASAERPDGVGELTATHETLAYLELDGKYLSGGVENATVEFAVEKSALGGLAEPDDVVVYQHDDDGAWTQVNATVLAEEDDGYRLAATADDLGTLAVGTDQSLAVADAGLEADEVATGETLTANVTVRNDGETAETGTVELAFDGNVVASETVEVAPGETTEVTLRGTAPATGTYEATIGAVSLGEVEVLETRPADVSVADVSTNESTIEAGEQVAITATVENTGGEAGEQTVSLTLFGEELESQTVRVEGGETEEVTFVRQIDAVGTYTAEVGDETVEIEVTESDDDGLTPDAPDVPGFGVGAALVALLAAALLARLRG